MIILIPDHCLSIYFDDVTTRKVYILKEANRSLKKMSLSLSDLIRSTLFLVKKTRLSTNMTLKSGNTIEF